MKKLFYFVMIIGCLASCNRDIIIEENATKNTQSPYVIAEDYVRNLLIRNNVAVGRSVYSDEYPEFLYTEDIVDENGNTMLFADMSDEEKASFMSLWERTTVAEVAEKIGENADIAMAVVMENTAVEEAVRMAARFSDGVVVSSEFTDTFFNALENAMKKQTMAVSRAGGSSSGNEVMPGCLVASSVEKLKSVYKKGRFLVTLGTGSSFGFTGHASIMYEPEWKANWGTDSLVMTMVTSSPDGGVKWPEKTDGVQLEPLGYWAGNSSGSANKVYVYEVQKRRWVWNWLKSGYKYTSASSAECTQAADNAFEYIGKPYSLGSKWDTDKFYCSELVWRAWYDVSSDYNMNNFLGWVSPLDLMLSPRSKEVAFFHNK